jgi:hypothetical protein
MTGEHRQDLHCASDAELASAGARASTRRDDAEDAEIEREGSAASAESVESGDTRSRLAEWRTAERAIDDTDPATVEGEELRDDALKAHDAYTVAEHAQRNRHGIPDP